MCFDGCGHDDDKLGSNDLSKLCFTRVPINVLETLLLSPISLMFFDPTSGDPVYV